MNAEVFRWLKHLERKYSVQGTESMRETRLLCEAERILGYSSKNRRRSKTTSFVIDPVNVKRKQIKSQKVSDLDETLRGQLIQELSKVSNPPINGEKAKNVDETLKKQLKKEISKIDSLTNPKPENSNSEMEKKEIELVKTGSSQKTGNTLIVATDKLEEMSKSESTMTANIEQKKLKDTMDQQLFVIREKMNLDLKRRVFHGILENAQLWNKNPMFQEVERLRKVEELGTMFAKKLFQHKYFGLWKTRLRQHKEGKRVRKKRKKSYRVNFEPYQFVRKPSPEPIEADPVFDDMMNRGVEMKERARKQVQDRIRQDREKSIEEERERQKALERQKHNHQKKLRQEHQKRAQEYQAEQQRFRQESLWRQKVLESEKASNNRIVRTFMRHWIRYTEEMRRKDEHCKKEWETILEKKYFNVWTMKATEKQHCLEDDALYFRNKKLFNKVRMGIRLNRLRLQEAFKQVQQCVQHHHLQRHFIEWKEVQIAKKRQTICKADSLYLKLLKRRAFRALPKGITKIHEDEKQTEFRNRLMHKAQTYLNQLEGTDYSNSSSF